VLEFIDLEDTAIAVAPDHYTPCRLKTHSRGAVPFLLWKPGEKPDGIRHYDEASAAKGSLGTIKPKQFAEMFLK
jgi:2,3-bisphosphoglycerate-independent phosphoglycerate mutase